eukprot:4132749-Amphidinium_carterae.1
MRASKLRTHTRTQQVSGKQTSVKALSPLSCGLCGLSWTLLPPGCVDFECFQHRCVPCTSLDASLWIEVVFAEALTDLPTIAMCMRLVALLKARE